MTAPDFQTRDALFKSFGRAFFKRDAALLYQVVTPDFVWHSHDGRGGVARLDTREAVAARLQDAGGMLTNVRFHDVVYHHAGDETFMTFRLTGSDTATEMPVEHAGIERYTFRDGRIASKDVYRKPVA